MKQDDAGYVYVLTNPSMPGLVKIGKTTNSPEHRAKELSRTTGVPTPFSVVFSVYTDECSILERNAHSHLSEYRLENREFFKISVDDAIKGVIEMYLDRKDCLLSVWDGRKAILFDDNDVLCDYIESCGGEDIASKYGDGFAEFVTQAVFDAPLNIKYAILKAHETNCVVK